MQLSGRGDRGGGDRGGGGMDADDDAQRDVGCHGDGAKRPGCRSRRGRSREQVPRE